MNSRTMVTTMATAVSVTSAIPVGEWNHLAIEVATFAAAFAGANVAINVKVSNDIDGTYQPLQKMINSGSTLLVANVAIPASVGGYTVSVPEATKFNYMKLDTDVVTSNAVSFRINVAL